MFTGIITHTGTISRASELNIAIRTRRGILGKLDRGTSISVDGACLTVVSKEKDSFTADIMLETARRTTLSSLRRGTKVNLELPSTPSSLLSGHIVQGHIDGIGTLKQIRIRGTDRILSITIPRTISQYVVEKGSIAINGISLTVIEARYSYFTVGIIPHTWETTMLREITPGSHVHIEVDVLAKYIEKLINKRTL